MYLKEGIMFCFSALENSLKGLRHENMSLFWGPLAFSLGLTALWGKM